MNAVSKNYLTKIIALIIPIFTFLFFIVDIFIHKNHQFVSGYLCNVITETLGIIVTYGIIQIIIDKHNKKKEQKEESDQIRRHNKIIKIYLDYYKQYFWCITTPYNKRESSDGQFNKQFELKDLSDLYKPSGMITVPLYKPAVELFYEHERELRKIFENTINQIDFKYYKDFQELLTDFIKNSLMYDVKDSIVSYKQQYRENSGICGECADVTNAHAQEYYEKSKLVNHHTNYKAIPYFILYDLLKIEQQLIIKYESLINELESKTN